MKRIVTVLMVIIMMLSLSSCMVASPTINKLNGEIDELQSELVLLREKVEVLEEQISQCQLDTD